ncbi:leucine-rich repeat protein [Enterococcus faecalis]|uniref:leucine-rich repeat protein n=1 Tax=Enterococcus faecalis TaxID=1351 RepID=UPI0034CE1CA1
MTNGTSQGLFAVISIVIFGIFVLISYLLFKGSLRPSLSRIFTDSLEQSEENLIGIVKEKPINVQSSREDETFIYAKIREANEAKGEKEIGVQAKKLDDNTLQLHQTSVSDENYNRGSSDMTGSLSIPDEINGMKIISINNFAFFKSKFTGGLKLPNGLTIIGNKPFGNSKFTGELNVSNITYIQGYAFYSSKIVKVLRGDAEMNDGSSWFNTSGIHPLAIKLANGEWYNGSNDN